MGRIAINPFLGRNGVYGAQIGVHGHFIHGVIALLQQGAQLFEQYKISHVCANTKIQSDVWGGGRAAGLSSRR